MIIGRFDQILDYAILLPHLAEGLKTLSVHQDSPVGKIFFDGGFLLIQEGVTKPFADDGFEAHRQFIDVQIVVKGAEEIAWADLGDLKTTLPYDEVSDKEKLSGKTTHRIWVTEGMFWVAFPRDGHQAIAHTDLPHTYRKFVIKLSITKGGTHD